MKNQFNRKKPKLLLILTLFLSITLLSSCSKEDLTLQYLNEVVGDYSGYIVYDNGNNIDSFEATGEVIKNNDYQVTFNCQSSIMDTTLILDVFDNGDRLEMCLTGDDFNQMYGHPQGERHMGHMGRNQNGWQHHMDDEHDQNDEHYGGFHHGDGAMEFTFLMGSNLDRYVFYGSKK